MKISSEHGQRKVGLGGLVFLKGIKHFPKTLYTLLETLSCVEPDVEVKTARVSPYHGQGRSGWVGWASQEHLNTSVIVIYIEIKAKECPGRGGQIKSAQVGRGELVT